MTEWLSTILIFLPMAAAVVVWLVPMPRLWVGSLATLVSLVEVGFWISRRRALRLRRQLAAALAAALVVLLARRLVLRRHVRVLALARRAHGRLRGGSLRLRLVGRPRAAARVLRPPAPADRLGRRRLLRAGPAPLLRLLRGDADPALRADRRLGRPGAARRDDQVRRVHRRRLAADARRDHRLRPPGGDVRPDGDGDELERVALPRLRDRLRGQGAALAVPRLAARCLPGVAGRGLGPPLGRDLEGRRVRLPADRDRQVP